MMYMQMRKQKARRLGIDSQTWEVLGMKENNDMMLTDGNGQMEKPPIEHGMQFE